MEKSERFGLVLTPTEKKILNRIAAIERISSAAVIRRLIWREAKCLILTNNQVDQGRKSQEDIS